MTVRPITEDDLHAFADNALDAARQAEVAAYLDGHPDVAERVQGYIEQREELRAAFAPVAEEPVPMQLNVTHLIAARRRSFALWRRVAAAAVIFFAIGGAGGWSLHGLMQPANEGIPALAREAAYSYDVYAPDRLHPVEFKAADRSELVSWVSARLKQRVAVPDLSASGYRFMGGRLVATGHGPAVLFMYDNDRGTRLVMLTRPMAVDKNTHTMAQDRHGDVTGFTWSNAGVGYSLVGPVPPQTLHPIADDARRQVDRNI